MLADKKLSSLLDKQVAEAGEIKKEKTPPKAKKAKAKAKKVVGGNKKKK